MAAPWSDTEKAAIRAAIKGKYTQVAASGAACCFQYPTGEESLRQQNYPLDIVQELPPSVVDAFCGVGNPFSLGPIYPGEAILDIGCGAGFDAFVAARLTGPRGRVVGLDVTVEMINRARANQALLGLDRVRFQVEDAESLPFPDQEFDVVISNGVLNLTLDKARALQEAHRVLKPGGRLMLADMVLVQDLPPEEAGKADSWFQ
jgi:arsenite methyltransferase